jgi:hypothetical protein
MWEAEFGMPCLMWEAEFGVPCVMWEAEFGVPCVMWEAEFGVPCVMWEAAVNSRADSLVKTLSGFLLVESGVAQVARIRLSDRSSPLRRLR